MAMLRDVTIIDHTKEFKGVIRRATQAGLRAAAIQLVREVREGLGGGGPSTPGGIGDDWFVGRVKMLSETVGAKWRKTGAKITWRRRAVKTPSAPGQPPRKQTGTLARSITHDFSDIKGFIVRVGSNYQVARFMELGTSHHPIDPVEAKMLAWPGKWKAGKGGKITGEMVFKKHVEHPGTAPRPFLRPAFDRFVARGGVQRFIRDKVQAMERKI